MLQNRQLMKRTFPLVFEASQIRPIDDYPNRLLEILLSLAPAHLSTPTVAVFTLGIYNSAYFERLFLAQQMEVKLVEGRE